jgi:hypothetical protein
MRPTGAELVCSQAKEINWSADARKPSPFLCRQTRYLQLVGDNLSAASCGQRRQLAGMIKVVVRDDN